MFKVQLIFPLLLWAWLAFLAIFLSAKSIATTMTSTAKPGCPTQCGNITVPYPFGIGLDGACSIGEGYSINCNTSFNPPKVFLEETNLEIVDFSQSGDREIRLLMLMAIKCFKNGKVDGSGFFTILDLNNTPLVVSETANKFIVVGCDDYGVIRAGYGSKKFAGGVISVCNGPDDVINGSCSGSGCQQTSIPKGLKGFDIVLGSANLTDVSSYNNCSYGFVGEYSKYTFSSSDLSDPGFSNRMEQNIPVVLEWTIGGNQTCWKTR